MNPNLIRIIIAIFLIAHGWIHYSLTYVPTPKPGELRTPFWPSWQRSATDPAWLSVRLGFSNPLVRGLGSALWLLTLACFCLAGLGLLGIPGLQQTWMAAAGLGAVASLLLLVLYWHPWLFVGAAINVVVLAGLAVRWPQFLFA